MTSRNAAVLALVCVVVALGAFWSLRGSEKPKLPEAVVSSKTTEPARVVPTVANSVVAVVPSESASGLPPGHFEEKRRLQEEAAEALLAMEEAKYAKIDFSAPRPGPPPPRAPVQGKNEEEMTMAEKAAQVARLHDLIKDRLARTQTRLEAAKKAGDAEETKRLETMQKRLVVREAELNRRGKILRGEDVPREAPPTPSQTQ